MNERDLFLAALDIDSPSRRSAYLDEACGVDAALRDRVDAMLRFQGEEHRFLQEPFVARDESEPLTLLSEGPGTVIGRYKLLEQIGEGGFGVVYMAEQREPMHRRVALKIIKLGMDTKQVVGRFEAERQALAIMDHPNIAKVFDGGATSTGRPYFVMELVNGVAVTRFCDANRLNTQQRLDLFIQVCGAVGHAHQKGIIHRDLKPSNILVTRDDHGPVPKVIDFGVAKATQHRLTERTVFTRFQHFIGTPAYMSPEQAMMSGVDIDTRSDIYSLGVLLYELLTGTTPLDAHKLLSDAYDELCRRIREDEPPLPSTRISTLGGQLQTVADNRNTDARLLRRTIRGELDWIVMKALEKDRARRYETANAFAEDVRRYLDDEAVLAYPPSKWYRFQKLARRNKVAIATMAAVVLALAAGLGAAMWGLAEAKDQRSFAQTERDVAREARRMADLERSAADDARRNAEQLRSQVADRADQLARQIYLIHLANADRALLEKDYVRARTELDASAVDERGWEWRLLDRRMLAAVPLELPGAEQPIFTRDGKRLIAIGMLGSPDEDKALIWDLASGSRSGELPHESKISSLALSPDEKWLAGGDYHGELVLWNIETERKVWSVKKNEDKFDGMAFSPDGRLIATANWDGTLKVFDASNGAVKFSLSFDYQLRKVTFSPDGRWIAAGFNLKQEPAFLVNASTGTIAAGFPTMGSRIPTFSPDGQRIATGNADGTITVWRWDGHELIEDRSWQAADNYFWALDFSADGTRLASSAKAIVKVWDVATGKEVAVFDAGDDVYWLAMTPGGDEVAIFTSVYGIRLWRFMEQENSLTIRPHERPSNPVKFSPDSQSIAIGSYLGRPGQSALDQEPAASVIILDSASGRHVNTLPGTFQRIAWMPDSQHIVVSCETQYTHAMYKAMTGDFVRGFLPADSNHAWPHAWPYVDQSGGTLTSVGRDTVRAWDLKSGQPKLEFPVAPEGPWIAAVDPEGRRVAIAVYANFKVTIWDTGTRSEAQTLPTPGRWPFALAFTEDGSRLYVGSDGGKLSLFDIESQQELKRFVGHADDVRAVASSPDEKQIVSGGDHGRVIVWDVESSQPLVTLTQTDVPITALDWSSNGKHIVAGKEDGTVQIWTLDLSP